MYELLTLLHQLGVVPFFRCSLLANSVLYFARLRYLRATLVVLYLPLFFFCNVKPLTNGTIAKIFALPLNS